MESSRTSLAALERAARNSVQPDSASDAETTRMQWSKHVAGIAIVALAVANLVTWRALVNERVAWQEAERAPRGGAGQTSSAWPASISQWSSLRQITQNAIPGSVPPAAQVSATSLTAGSMNTAVVATSLAKALADRKAHDALRDQQKGSALQLYGELIKRWHLSSQAAAPILDVLAEHELNQFAGLLGGDPNTPNNNAADEAGVQAVLTPKQLEELRAYDASLPDRMTITPLLSQLQLEGTPLPADRVDELVSIMHEERVAVPPPDATTRQGSTTGLAQAIDEWQVALDQRIRDRAALILSPDALSRLETFQNSERAANSVFTSLGPGTAPPAVSTLGSGPN